MLFASSAGEGFGISINNEDLLGDSGSLNTIFSLINYIEQSIDQLNYDTAEFLSEILYAETSTLEDNNSSRIDSIYLYSLSLYLNQNYLTSLQISKTHKNRHVGISYIYGLSALKLNKHLSDAFNSLLTAKEKTIITSPSSQLVHHPTTATVFNLLGKIAKELDKTNESAMYYSEALNKNPFLWESYTELTKMRATVDLKSLFRLMNKRSQSSSHLSRNKYNSISKNFSTPFKPAISASSSSSSASNLASNFDQQHYLTASLRSSNKKSCPSNSILNRTNVTVPTTESSILHHSKQPSTHQQASGNTVSKNQRRNKLASTPPSKTFAAPEKLNLATFKTPRTTMTVTHGSAFGVATQSVSDVIPSKINQSKSLPLSLPEILYTFTRILTAASVYDLYKAVRLINSSLPSHLKDNMPWCQAQLGKLHFELVNYDVSLQYFTNLRKLQPTRVKDLEIYSTLLWHLRDKVKLSLLANELTSSLPNKPETWCSLGNFHSLQKDHTEAVRAFEKATELDPNFAYAYTLQGHEHSSNDAFDSAKHCYRKALACDPHHYNAYYGLGMCCMKLGQYEEALLHFEKARSINAINVILICCCGVAVEKLKYQEKALEYYELACQLQPSSSLATFKRAHLLYSMGRYSIALQHFEELTKIAPDEATVHFLLGQLYQILGRKKDAVKEFTISMNLDPKGSQVIMEALEKCHAQD